MSCQLGSPSPYLNNIIEQDHRFIKKRIAASLGFRSAEGAWRTIGYEAMYLIRKGQIRWQRRELKCTARFFLELKTRHWTVPMGVA